MDPSIDRHLTKSMYQLLVQTHKLAGLSNKLTTQDVYLTS